MLSEIVNHQNIPPSTSHMAGIGPQNENGQY